MMGKLQEVKKKAEEIKVRLDAERIEVSGANGELKVIINGNKKIQKVELSPALQTIPIGDLQEHLLLTINQAIAAADKLSAEEMKKIAGGFLPPGLF